ncbi:hypothetical protein ACC776_37275, partial [Rhizobium johnstonii]
HQPTFDRGTGVTTMPVVAMQMPSEPVERDVYGELLNATGACPKPSLVSIRMEVEAEEILVLAATRPGYPAFNLLGRGGKLRLLPDQARSSH